MNIPFQVSDTDSQEILAEVTPPTSYGPTGTSQWIDVRGWQWIEFIVTLTNQNLTTELEAVVEYKDTSAAERRLTVEEVDGGTGGAPQVDYVPSRAISADTVWGVPVPIHGTQMRILLQADAAGTDKVTVRALRRT